MSHVIHSVFYSDISLDDLYSTEHHDLRWGILVLDRLPEFSSFHIFFLSIEYESCLIGIVYATVDIIRLVSEEFIDLDSFRFSLYCYGIEFTQLERITDPHSSSLGYDRMYTVFFSSSFQSRCEIHCISEYRIVKMIG